MRRRNLFIVRWLAIPLLTITLEGWASAQTPSSPPVDVMLALDNSGSMKHNDPSRLLKQAVTNFADRLRSDTQVGVVLFDQRVELVLSLTSVSDPSFAGRLSEALKQVDYSGKWTDIPGGIERAIYTLNHDGRKGSRRAIVFFTDGIIETGDPAKDLERGRWLRENLAAEARERGIRVFGVAFTDTADYELIESIAQVTGGDHYRVLRPADIGDAFQQISQRLQEPLPATAQKPNPNMPPPESGGIGRWALVAIALVAVIAIVAVVFTLRRDSGAKDPGLLAVPTSDLAHLIDVGRHTGTDRVPLQKRRTRIGRDKQLNDVCIPEATVTSQHAAIEYRDGSFFLRDLRSSNGTFVNGKKISDPDVIREVNLKPGDRIRFDAFEFVFAFDAQIEEAKPRTGEAVQRGKTRLRGDAGLRAPSPQPLAGAPLEPQAPAAPIQKGVPAETRVRSEFCPNHPSWKATVLCPKCGVGKCEKCMTEKDGKHICHECAA